MSKAGTRKLFGTDGIRGIAGEPPLDAKTIYATGLALGHSLRGMTEPKVLLGRDTRESSPWIAATVAVYLAAFRDYRAMLAPGERGTLPIVACARRQGHVIDLCRGVDRWRGGGGHVMEGFRQGNATASSGVATVTVSSSRGFA